MNKKDLDRMTTEDLLRRVPRHSQTGEVLPNDTGWQTRHFDAINTLRARDIMPGVNAQPRKSQERALVIMLQGWLAYADAHRAAFDSLISEDGVLGPSWLDIGKAMLTMLNGELGRMDGGTLDGVIRDAMLKNGVDMEKEGL
jgi:hypothetical protein